MDADRFFSDVRKLEAGESLRLSSCYLFFGEEDYLVEAAQQEILRVMNLGELADFNQRVFWASELSGDEVQQELQTLPMMAPRRLVVVKEVQSLSDKQWESLASHWSSTRSGDESAVLVLLGSTLDRRKKSAQIWKSISSCVEFRAPFESQIPGWILRLANQEGVRLSPEAVRELHHRVGSHLRDLHTEILKLRNHEGLGAAGPGTNQLGQGESFSLTDQGSGLGTARTSVGKIWEAVEVAEVIPRRPETVVFTWIEGFFHRDFPRTLQGIRDLALAGQSQVGMVSLLARHARILLQVHEGRTRHQLDGQKLADWIRVPAYFVRTYVQQSKLWSEPQLRQLLLQLAELDQDLKGARRSPGESFANFVTTLHVSRPLSEARA